MRYSFAIMLLVFVCGAFAEQALPDLTIEEIQQGIYLHTSYNHVDGFGLVSANGLIVVDDGNAFIVDTPWSERDTEKLVAWIAGKNYELLGTISTHSHEDRTAGIQWLNAHSIPTYASALTNELLKREGKPLTQNAFESAVFPLADGLIEAYYPGAGHAVDNIVIWIPKAKVLFGGCLVRERDTDGLGYTGEADIPQWSHSVENVLHRYPEARLVVPGHGSIGDIQLLEHTQKLAETAANDATASSAEVSGD